MFQSCSQVDWIVCLDEYLFTLDEWPSLETVADMSVGRSLCNPEAFGPAGDQSRKGRSKQWQGVKSQLGKRAWETAEFYE